MYRNRPRSAAQIDASRNNGAHDYLVAMNEDPGSFAQALAFESIAGAGKVGQLLDRYQSRHTRNFLRLLKTLEDRRTPARVPVRPSNTKHQCRAEAAHSCRRAVFARM